MQANFAWFEASSSNKKLASALVSAEFSEYVQFLKHLLQGHENNGTPACQCL